LEAAGLKDVGVTVTGTSSCIHPETQDLVGQALWEGAEDEKSVSENVVSIQATAHK